MHERLYAYQITNRKITILDVPKGMRDDVLALLPEHDRKRSLALLEDE